MCIYRYDPEYKQYMYVTKPHLRICSGTTKDHPVTELKWWDRNPEMLYANFTTHLIKFTINSLITCSNLQKECVPHKIIAIFKERILDFVPHSDLHVSILLRGRIHLINQLSEQILFKTDIDPTLLVFW
jgi:hypothetical protein